jgi:hypothetical protein
MGLVVIKCPSTGKEVPTGFAMDKASFASSSMSGNSFTCPACRKQHTWNKADATVKE